jgi:acyl carrier protein
LINLDEASKSIPLDFFVLLSSISSSLGNPGQADYSTANAFMDAYAVYRNTMVTEKQREGLTLSVNWPLWQEGGMQINEKTLNLMKQSLGITPIGSRDGVQALYGSMAAGEDRIMVLAGDVPKIKELLLETVTRVETEPAESLNQHPDDEKLFEKTLYMMKNLFGEVIRLDASKIDSEASFDNYGVDSILVVQLNQKLDEVYEGLSKTLFYEYENLKDITAHLIAQYPQVCIRWAGLEAQAPVKTEAQLNAFESRSAFYAQALPEEKTNTERVSSFSVQQDGRQEPIAIIGISGRYPRASTLEEYWENLKAGKDCIIEIPKERWELDGFSITNHRRL